MRRDVVVTGYGAVSPYGLGVARFWDGLMAGVSAVRPIRRFDASVYRTGFAAEVPEDIVKDKALREAHGDPGELATYYAVVAATEAFAHAGLADIANGDEAVACIVGTLCSGADDFAQFARAFTLNGNCATNASAPPFAQVNYQLDFLADHFNLRGPAQLVSTACSSSTDAMGLAGDMIQSGICDIALAGGGDILTEPVHAGFSSLHALSKDVIRPFDKRRNGFAIGEGAGFVVLEAREHAQARGAVIHAELLGYGLSNTATSLTAPSSDGAAEALAVQRALDDARVAPEAIDYVNTHGTATPLNDMAEAKAIARVFGPHAAAMAATSIKPMIGHCMGAAGILEAISTILSLRQGRIPATLGSSADMDELTIAIPLGAPLEKKLRRAVSQSFGFGGACSAIVLA